MTKEELKRVRLENRLDKMSTNPVENANLMRKVKRQLRNMSK